MINESARFEIGAGVTCRNDVAVGQLKQVVADPLARRLTHLVIGSSQSATGDRLVPIALAHAAGAGVVLSCDAAGFDALRPAVETEFIAGSLDESGYGPEQTYLWPNYALSTGGMGTPGFRSSTQAFDGGVGHLVATEQLPPGDVGFRRGCAVTATDGAVGHLHGLIIDPATSQITHLLLEHGHLWGHREIAIPAHFVTAMAATDATDADIHLNVSKSEVDELPEVAHAELVPR